MRTDDLIRALAEDTRPEPPPARRVVPVFLPAVALSMAGLLAVLGPRPDLAQALTSFVPAMRHVLSLALFAVALTAALTAIRPEGHVRLWPLALVAAVALGLLAWAWMATLPEARGMALMGKTNSICLIAIPI
ncbi:MAG: NrsF family protein, partial [Paracoccaceae bacterium]